MKKLFLILLLVIAGAGGFVWYTMQAPTSITNKGITYDIHVDGGKRTSRNGMDAIAITRDKTTYTFVVTTDPIYQDATCPTIASEQITTLVIVDTTSPLCKSASGGVILSPFEDAGQWHAVLVFSDGIPDYDFAKQIFGTVAVRD